MPADRTRHPAHGAAGGRAEGWVAGDHYGRFATQIRLQLRCKLPKIIMTAYLDVDPITFDHCGDGTLVTLTVRYGSTVSSVWVRAPDRLDAPPQPGDAALTLALLAAMLTGRTLRLSQAVSPELLESVPRIQSLLTQWYPELSAIEVISPPVEADEPPEFPQDHRKVPTAHFFSAGVDSLHSILEHRHEIDCLVFIEGADIPEASEDVRRQIVERVRLAASAIPVPLLVVRTNVCEWTRQFGHFGDHFIATRIAFVAHLVSSRYERWFLAPSTSLMLRPFYSHPFLDPLFSSRHARIIHDFDLFSRARKIEFLAASGVTLRHLRVCMRGTDYNCGRCVKCRRTMLALYALGALEQCGAFPPELDLDETFEILFASAHPETEQYFVTEILELCRKVHADPALIERLEEVKQRSIVSALWAEVAKAPEAFFRQPPRNSIPYARRRLLFTWLLARNPEWLEKELRSKVANHRDALFDLLWRTDRKWLFKRALTRHLGRLLGKQPTQPSPENRENGDRAVTSSMPFD